MDNSAMYKKANDDMDQYGPLTVKKLKELKDSGIGTPLSRIDEILKSKKAPGTIKHTSLHKHDHTCLG